MTKLRDYHEFSDKIETFCGRPQVAPTNKFGNRTAPQTGIYRSVYRCPPSSWLSLWESWREATERAHCTDFAYKLPTEPLHRFLIRNCIPQPTVCTTPLPLPSGGTSPHGARQGLGANFKQFGKRRLIAPTEGLAQAKAPLCKGLAKRCRR